MRRIVFATAASVGTLLASGVGCAGTGSTEPAIASQPSFEVPSNGLGQRSMASQESTGFTGWLSSTGEAIGSALTIEETVIPAEDGVDLNSKPVVTPGLHAAQARLLEGKGDLDGAIAKYEEALKLDPKFLSAKLALARALDRRGDAEGAERRYRELTAEAPQDAVAFNDLGLFLARRGKLTESRDALETAVRLEPKSPLYRNNLAAVHVEAGEPVRAAECLEPVFGKAAASYNVAYLLKEREQFGPARDWAAHAAQLDPSMGPAHALAAESDRLLRVTSAPAAPTR